MLRRLNSVLAVAIVAALSFQDLPSLAADSVGGRVTDVTLYRGQALVTRAIPIEGDAGGMEVVVGNLPEQIVPNSLFAEGGDAVEIRAVRFRTRAVGEEPREEVRKLDQELLDVQQQIDLTAKRQALLGKRTEYLGKLEGFVAPTAHGDLAKGVLDAEALERVTTFAFAQHETIAEEEVKLARQSRDLQQQLELLQRKRGEITAGASKTEREAVLFLQKQAAGPAEVRLNYLVNSCGWSPAYTMRSGAERKQVRIEYNALIQQLTGEDWTDVNLTLSTASPALSAAGPGLAPFHVTLGSGGDLFGAANPPTAPQPTDQTPQQTQPSQQVANFYGRGLSKGQALEQLQGLNTRRSQVAQAGSNAVMFEEQNRINWSLNDVAYGLQQLELNCDATTLSVLRNGALTGDNGPSLSYELRGGVSLASRSDQQMVRIMQTDMESRFYHVAVPVLTPYVFREAELKNSGDEDLLAGPITVYLDGRFVGQGEIPTVARGQTFVVGFGADPQLRSRRELADKQDGVQGGNRETRFDYRIVVENFSNEATPVRVIDRVPHAENGEDIRVTLGKTNDPVSEDKLYLREERPMGILRWDVEVPANASGESARLVEYQYTIEYDRQYVVSLPESKQRLQEEFERLQRERQKR
jgi:hypothetical protein